MKKGKGEPAHGVPFQVGDRVVTPDGVTAIIVNVDESSILVRFEPGESLGIYPHGVLRPHEEVN